MIARPRNSIHIKNLPDEITYNDVWTEFKKLGDIVNVTIPVDVNTAKAKGYAFVEYSDCQNAAKAITVMNGVQLWGRILTVEYSRSYPKTSREMALRSILNPVQTALWPTMTPSAPVIPPRSRSFSSSARSSSRSTDRCSSSSSSYCSRRYSPGSRSRSSCSRRSCSCCSRSRERRRRSTIDSRSHSRRSVSSRGARRSVSGSIDRKSRRKPRSTGPTSEGEVTDFDDDDLSGSDTSLGDIPDSVVIAANLMHSPPSSVSLYSASSRSSSFSTPRKRKRSKEGKRCRSRFSSRYSSTRSSTGASRHSRRR
ncbi:unnamed protein product [Dicrocoelium dendriticum]|nr:unnamed protein product [Dicrocoelium dendriticum]